MNVIYAPAPITKDKCGAIRIFLGGSIEMGKAIDWQQALIEHFRDQPVTLFNPRRPDWDTTWTQDPSFAPFFEQVNWEQDAIELSDIVIINFCAGTMSPISLLELGIMLGRAPHKLVICCPKDYARYGNVAITCQRHGVKVYDNIDDVAARIKDVIDTAIKLVASLAHGKPI